MGTNVNPDGKLITPYPRRDGRRGDATAQDVLETFAVYQPRTAEMVAAATGINRTIAERVLSELETRGELTRARGGTDVPVWFRPHRD